MEPRMSKKEEKSLYILGWMLFAAAVLLLGITKGLHMQMKIVSLPCVFRELTGYCCPGCGGTRACAALLQGKIVKSFLCHPVVLYTAVIYGWYMITHTIEYLTRGKLVPRPVSLFSSRHHTDTVGSAESPETDMGN